MSADHGWDEVKLETEPAVCKDESEELTAHQKLLYKYNIKEKPMKEPISTLTLKTPELSEYQIPKVTTEDFDKLKNEARLVQRSKVDLENVNARLKKELEELEAKKKLGEDMLKEQIKIKTEKQAELNNEMVNHRERAEEGLQINMRMLKEIEEKDSIIEALVNKNDALEKNVKSLKNHFSTTAKFEEYVKTGTQDIEKLPKDVQDVIKLSMSFPSQYCLLTARKMMNRMGEKDKTMFYGMVATDASDEEIRVLKDLLGLEEKGKVS